jgi:hypothetical protein
VKGGNAKIFCGLSREITYDQMVRTYETLNAWRLGAIMSGAVALTGVAGYISERKKRKASPVQPPTTSERKLEGNSFTHQ